MERDRGAQLHRPACVSCPLGEDRPWGGNLSPFTRPCSALGVSSLCNHIPIPMGKQLRVPTLPPRINPVPWPRVILQERHVGFNNPTMTKLCLLNGVTSGGAGCCLAHPSSCPNFPLPSTLPSQWDFVPSHQDANLNHHRSLVCASPSPLPSF